MNLKTCFRPLSLSTGASIALLLLRLVAGIAFVYHGLGKIQNPFTWMGPDSAIPGIFLLLAAVSEFGGGILWILGLLTRLASLGIFLTMLVATYFHAVVMGDPFVSGGPGQGAFEPALLYATVSLVLFFVGPGCFSLDKLIFKEKK